MTINYWNDNQLSGPIPTELGNLVSLHTLYLDDNQLNGTIPSSLGFLMQLTRLDLFTNTELVGTVPPTLCSNPGIGIYIDCDNIDCTCCRNWSSTGPNGSNLCPSTEQGHFASMQHTRKISDYNVNRDDRVEYDRMLLRYPTTRSTTSATPTATSTISRNPRLRDSIILCYPDYTIRVCTKG